MSIFVDLFKGHVATSRIQAHLNRGAEYGKLPFFQANPGQ